MNIDQLALARVNEGELNSDELIAFFNAKSRPSTLSAADRATVQRILESRKIGYASDDGLDRQQAIGALRDLSDEQMQLVMKHIERSYFITEFDHAALDDVFREKGIKFKTTAQAATSVANDRVDAYKRVLDGRDVQDVDDATFAKASSVLTRGIR